MAAIMRFLNRKMKIKNELFTAFSKSIEEMKKVIDEGLEALDLARSQGSTKIEQRADAAESGLRKQVKIF